MSINFKNLFNEYMSTFTIDSMYCHVERIINDTKYNSFEEFMVDMTTHFEKLLRDSLDTDNSKQGYIYCVFNEMFLYYGPNFYKLGRAGDAESRLSQYTTYYPNISELKLKSKKIKNCVVAENLLFLFLEKYRYKINKEFFNCEFSIIKNTFEKIEDIFDNHNITDIVNKWFPNKINIKMTKIRSDILDMFEDCKFKQLFQKNGMIVNYTIKGNINRKNITRSKITENNNIFKEKLTREELLETKNIDEFEYNLKKEANASVDKLQIEKYKYKRFWKTDVIDNNFLENCYGKMEILINIRYLFGKDNMNNNKIRLDNTSILEKTTMLKDIFNKLGFNDLENNINNKKLIDRETFGANVNKVLLECTLFNDVNKSQPFFGFSKPKISGVKSFMGFINSLLKEWGLKIKSNQKNIKIKVNNKWTVKAEYYYCVIYIADINKYI